MRLFFISLFFISSACLYAQQRNNIDTLNIFSLAMNKDVKVVLINRMGIKKQNQDYLWFTCYMGMVALIIVGQ